MFSSRTYNLINAFSLTVSLGPLMGTMDPKLKIKANPDRAGYGDNTRCLRRDVNNNLVTTTLKPAELAAQILGASSIATFQNTLQNDQGSKMAIHSSGHYSIWGE
jgi:tyrosinase